MRASVSIGVCGAGLTGLLLTLIAGPARADEPLLLGIEAGATIPLSAPQSDRFLPGGTLALALHTPLTPWLVPVMRARGTLLFDGPAPSDVTLQDPGVGASLSATAGLRLRLRGLFDPAALERADGLFVEIDAGGALTGSLVRPFFEAGVGFGFAIGDVRIGPVARFMHLLHFDDPIDNRSAYLLTVGVEMVLFDRRSPVPIPHVPPIGDRDHDGILDPDDQCPDEPEDFDGFQDTDGCPDPDNDHDGILDPADQCPNEPEDMDRFADEDGCPDLDNDHDAFLDPQDSCPNEPETINGVDDLDGCPDEGLIQMVEDRIVIEETVLFDLNRARVKHSARPVLQAIVNLWRQHSEWERVGVEGHADARGDAEFNQALSERRARQVSEVLAELGMPAAMMEVAGYGATRPRDTRETEAGYQRNRRVEFVVVGRRATAEGAAGTGAPSGGSTPSGATP